MPRLKIEELRPLWRNELFSVDAWMIDPATAINPGEAGGYRVRGTAPFGAYLKPTRLCSEDTPRAANEKIVADLAYELGLSVPPVLLYRRPGVAAGEETRCCLSLIMYPEQYEWGLIFGITTMPPPVPQIIRASISRYSETLALDLWIGQTDRNNARNVILGVDPDDQTDMAFLFLDHAYTLNHGNRWAAAGRDRIEMVPIPQVFRDSIFKPRLVQGADRIAALPDETIRAVVSRIPDDYMTAAHKGVVLDGLVSRQPGLPEFVKQNF